MGFCFKRPSWECCSSGYQFLRSHCMKRIIKIIYYGLLAISLAFCFIPFFRVDLRTNINDSHVYVFQSLFIQGLPKRIDHIFPTCLYYLPILTIVVLAIPFINKIVILCNVFLGLSIVACFLGIFWINNAIVFCALLSVLALIVIVYNVYYFTNKDKSTT